VVPAQEVVDKVHAAWPLEAVPSHHADCVAKHWRYLDGQGWLGVIASVTQPFCRGCDRARLSASGSLYTCLFAARGLDLKGPMRGGATDAELLALVEGRWAVRDDRYSELRTEGKPDQPRVEMFHIGG
jgi:cyclic pyranopterin phosphate synthase